MAPILQGNPKKNCFFEMQSSSILVRIDVYWTRGTAIDTQEVAHNRDREGELTVSIGHRSAEIESSRFSDSDSLRVE